MTLNSFPFDGETTTETQYSLLFRELQDSGIASAVGALDFRVTADAGGMYVKIQPGFAIVRGHAVESTAVEQRTIEPAGNTARVDRVVLRLDPAANEITIEVIKGTSTTPPALTQTSTQVFELPLAQVVVDANATNIAAAKVADERRVVGGRVGVWANATRPVAPRPYTFGRNYETNVWEFWDPNTNAWKNIISGNISGTRLQVDSGNAYIDNAGNVVSLATSWANRFGTNSGHTRIEADGLIATDGAVAASDAILGGLSVLTRLAEGALQGIDGNTLINGRFSDCPNGAFLGNGNLFGTYGSVVSIKFGGTGIQLYVGWGGQLGVRTWNADDPSQWNPWTQK